MAEIAIGGSHAAIGGAGATIFTGNDNITLYLAGGGLTVTTNPYEGELFVHGHSPSNTYATAFIKGVETATANITLFVQGLGTPTKAGYLYIKGKDGWTNNNSYAPLYICTCGIGFEFEVSIGGDTLTVGGDTVQSRYAEYCAIGTIPLYMEHPMIAAGRTLFIKNTQTEVPLTIGRTLFINGTTPTYNTNIPLYLQNDAIGETCPLYIRSAETGKHGYIPYPGGGVGMPLVIPRPESVAVANLFLKAIDNTSNTYATLHTISIESDTGACTLVIPNVVAEVNSYIPLKIIGAEFINTFGDTETISVGGDELTVGGDSVGGLDPYGPTLFIQPHGVLTGTATLFIKDATTSSNSFIPLYVFGITDVTTGSITLALPDTHVESTISVPLYVFGW